MNKIFKDITNQIFGRLIVLCPTEKRGGDGSIIWKCQCVCGNTTEVSSNNLRSNNHTQSCGCLKREITKAGANKKHGLSKEPLFSVWRAMNRRCYNPIDISYHNYGGKGITVCPEWRQNPGAFIEWGLANGYQKGLTIDRRNNGGSYSPQNCRFATYLEQANNTSWLKLFIAYGPQGQIEVAKNRSAFARKWGLTKTAISYVLYGRCKQHKGWTFEYLTLMGDV